MNDELVNRGWQQMELLLDERMPVERKRRYAGFYWLAGAAILLTAIAALYFYASTQNAPIASNQNQKNNSVQIASEKLNTVSADAEQAHASIINQNSPAPNSTINNNNKSTESNAKAIHLKSDEKPAQKTFSNNKNQSNSQTLNSRAVQPKTNHNISQSTSNFVEQTNKSANTLSTDISLSQNSVITGQSMLSNQQPTLQEQINNTVSIRHNLINPDLFNPSIERLDLLSLNPLDYKISSPSLALNTLTIQPKPSTMNSSGRWEIYMDGLAGNELIGASLGIALVHRISSKFSLTTGIEFDHYRLNDFKRENNSSLPSDEIFNSGNTYSSYLADNSIKSSQFISSISSIFAPINLRYALCNKMEMAIGIRPGVQVHQKISYAPVATSEIGRNPSIDNGNLTAEDFFYRKSVAVVQTSFGINYHLSSKFSIGSFYRISLSDYGRSVQYSSINKLGQLGAGEIDRRFFSIDSKEISPNLLGLRLTFRF